MTRGGYGRVYYKDTYVTATRYAWELANGPIPDGLFVLHRCDNPRCVNPQHLFIGTREDNMADMLAKGRQAKGHDVIHSKLTADDVRELRASPSRSDLLAEQFGVTVRTINQIRSRETWKHI